MAVVGATGRLGSAVVAACQSFSIPVTTTASSAGWETGAVPPRVVIDASHPDACEDTLDYCARTGSALLYCVSNPPASAVSAMRALSARVPVAAVANLSALHWVQTRLAELAGRLIGELLPGAEAAVIDRHPSTKLDAPSATARLLGDLLGPSATVVSERFGAPVADHRVEFTCGAESLVIGHAVRDLRVPAHGALLLAGRLEHAEPGWFTAADLYGRATAGVTP